MSKRKQEAAGSTAVVERPATGDFELCRRFQIDEENLALRRDFIRLGEEERSLLAGLVDWAERCGPRIVAEFYEYQFTFPATRGFFERYAARKNMPLRALRNHLEKAQAGYFVGIFQGARDRWGCEYFEYRMKIGRLHDQIDLPFKWYVGSYVEYGRLVRRYLREEWSDLERVLAADEAISKVFNYDLQAIGDSFLLNTLESLGLGLERIEVADGQDTTEHLDQVKRDVNVLLEQAAAIADDRLTAPVLETRVPGMLGDRFAVMAENLALKREQVRELATRLGTSSEELSAVSNQMATSSEQSLQRSGRASEAGSQINENIQSVASSAEEMATSIRDIAANINQAARVASNAVQQATATNQTIAELGESSTQIGKVIKVITSIAQQTNLLALNATIEAARAGEAGRGFAVVANEVKELAKETAKATEDISLKIEAIQVATGEAVGAIRMITDTINQISEISNSVAASVEQQAATTRDISRSAGAVAQDSGLIASALRELSQAAEGNKVGADNTLQAARDLSQLAAQLQQQLANLQ